MSDSDVSSVIKGIIISKDTGEHLFDLILDSSLNPQLLSSFAGALTHFGGENIGKIEDIIINGLDIQMVIVYKYHLILIAMLTKDVRRDDVKNEANEVLDLFYSLYETKLKNNELIDVNSLQSFKILLFKQFNQFYEKLNAKLA
ncbi:MAG: hypothetical protein GF317_21700 [Candidatus Lokiarchaeota archaeon]|nr:hypothetical protein [Candidatus Lokiarchaeota archaeon]MBD3202076.1 hypothetical protein [Candidatus Lokiarchaeota archaeon]